MDYISLEKFLEKKIEHAKTQILGTSVLGRFIYCVKFDFQSRNTVIIQAAIHARENITTDLCCKLIIDISNMYESLKKQGFPNIIFMPMSNPDGVELCYYGLSSVSNRYKRRELYKINKSKDFSLYKANANGVDLNTNFDAKWGSGKDNKLVKGSSDFIGESPMSEPEVQALALLTASEKPVLSISYHAKGEEIYYQFYNKPEFIKRDAKVAKIFAKALRYKIKNTQDYSSGGYKDWCILRHDICSLTIEVGSDKLKHPIKSSAIGQIYKRNKNIIYALIKANKLFN